MYKLWPANKTRAPLKFQISAQGYAGHDSTVAWPGNSQPPRLGMQSCPQQSGPGVTERQCPPGHSIQGTSGRGAAAERGGSPPGGSSFWPSCPPARFASARGWSLEHFDTCPKATLTLTLNLSLTLTWTLTQSLTLILPLSFRTLHDWWLSESDCVNRSRSSRKPKRNDAWWWVTVVNSGQW